MTSQTLQPAQQQIPVDIETLKGLEPISALSTGRIHDLAAQINIEQLEAGVCIFRAGDNDRKLIYLLNGEIELRRKNDQSVTIVIAGMPETWHPIGNKQPRQATATTRTEVELIRIDADHFDRIMTWDQVAMADATSGPADNNRQAVIKTAGDWRAKLRAIPAFNKLPPAHIEKLFDHMEPIDVAVGDVVIGQGEVGDYFYLIEHGVVSITCRSGHGAEAVELARLGAGASFGEEALLSDNPRNANVTMVTDGRLMRLSKIDFLKLLKEPLLEQIELMPALGQLERGAIFLDVRVASEYQQGHLPGAVNIPLNTLRQQSTKLDQRFAYICYCSSGRRSSAASFILSQLGFRSSVLQGGLQDVPGAYMIK